MTIPRKVQYNEALDSVNAILCQKIVKITQPLAWACWNYYVNFFLQKGRFYKILAVTTSEVAGFQVVNLLERT